ncbi:protein phosphatase [Streptomyces sp. NTH33]|uniref:PP2C family protein-serine/threonine phosphatase n=1 Tax=Streptomyces sp. NTH33 TaxID=1735453 RepID=UPI000DA7D7DC|nr:PP2C family protein-serine/threonine phosphatase [Streptomyces sp. NTH33]PZH14654.1 protein phosphatase [Streptomyces sp. NTH33]
MGLRQRVPRRQRSRQASDALLAVPLGLIVAIVLADLLTPRGVPLGPLLVVAPAITASFAGPALTGVMGGVAVAALMSIGVAHQNIGTLYFDSQIVSLLVVSVIVTVFRYLQVRHSRELTQVRTVSEAAQRVVLRPLPRRIGPLRVASMYLAAQEHALIGGDLYAAVRTSTGTRLIIGDVRGKGLTAISDAALLLGAFREAAHREATLPGLVAYLEHSVCWNLAEPTEEETAGECFITAAVLDIPDKASPAQMVTCGHPPPLLLRDGQVTALTVTRPAPPLGLGELSRPDYHVDTFTLEPSHMLLLHTDGVIEARDARGTFYPLAERAAACAAESPSALIRRLRTDLLAHVGGRLTDDAAMIALQRTRSQSPIEADRRMHEHRMLSETVTAVRRGLLPSTSFRADALKPPAGTGTVSRPSWRLPHRRAGRP